MFDISRIKSLLSSGPHFLSICQILLHNWIFDVLVSKIVVPPRMLWKLNWDRVFWDDPSLPRFNRFAIVWLKSSQGLSNRTISIHQLIVLNHPTEEVFVFVVDWSSPTISSMSMMTMMVHPPVVMMLMMMEWSPTMVIMSLSPLIMTMPVMLLMGLSKLHFRKFPMMLMRHGVKLAAWAILWNGWIINWLLIGVRQKGELFRGESGKCWGSFHGRKRYFTFIIQNVIPSTDIRSKSCSEPIWHWFLSTNWWIEIIVIEARTVSIEPHVCERMCC